MPMFKRRRTFRQRRRKFRRFRKSLRKKVKYVARRVSGIIKASVQYTYTSKISGSSGGLFTSVHNSSPVTTSNAVIPLTVLSQGSDEWNRTGDMVRFGRLVIKGVTTFSVAASVPPTAPVLGRIILTWVKANNGATLATGPSALDTLFLDWASSTPQPVLALPNPKTVPSRAVIVRDITLNCMNVNQTVSGSQATGRLIPWRINVNVAKLFRGAASTYNGNGVGTAACEKNHLFIYFVGGTAVPPTDPGTMTSVWSFRLSFLP